MKHLWMVCAAGCAMAAATAALAQPATLPAPGGPFPIGRTLLHLVDSSRVDPTAAVDGTKREFMALVWYPAAEKKAEYAKWMPPAWLPDEAQQAYFQRRRQLPDLTPERAETTFGAISGHAMEGAAVSQERRWPLLLFGPGAGVNPIFYTSFCEDLASYGYVVMALAPTGWLAMAVFPDGHKVPWSRKRSDDGAWINGVALPLWAGDMRYLLDRAAAMDADPASLMHGRLDLTRVGAFGHSFGGTASLRLARDDERIKAVVDLDGSPMQALGESSLGKPLLVLTHDMSPEFEPLPADERGKAKQLEAQSELSELYRHGKPSYRVRIKGAVHMTFSDMPVLPLWASVASRRGAPAGDGKELIDLVRAYIREFFGKFLLGERAPLLDRAPGAYGIAELQFTAR